MQETQQGLTTDLIIQYSIVGLILLSVFAWMIWKIVRMTNKNASSSEGCCGCALSDSCKKKTRKHL